MTTLSQLTGADAAAIGTLAIANGAAREDLSNVTLSDLLARAVSAGLAAATRAAPQNNLPNTQWQVRTALQQITAVKSDGTQFGSYAVSSYTTGSNTVVLTTADTTSLRVGMLGVVSGGAHANLMICALEISALTATTITVALPQGLTGASSAACTFTPIMIGDWNGTNTQGPDGWFKSNNLKLWFEDDPAVLANFPGCARVLGVLKTDSADAAVYEHKNEDGSSIGRLAPFLGRANVFGFKGRRFAGTGTIRATITSGAGATSASSPTTTDGWVEVTQVPAADSTALKPTMYLQGAAGTGFHIGLPVHAVGDYLGGLFAYSKPPNETIIPVRSYSPLSWRTVSWTSPASETSAGQGYGCTFRLYPESNGVYTKDIRGLAIAVGATQATAGAAIGIKSEDVASPIYSSPWLRTQVNSRQMLSAAALVMFKGGAAHVYSDTASAAFTGVEFDCGWAVL